MTEPRYDVLAIGNAIVDVIAETTDTFIESEGLTKGGMTLIDADRAQSLYDAMGPAREISGGSAANTLAGLARLGHKTAFIGQVADDQLGDVFAHDIRAGGIDFDIPARPGQPPAAVRHQAEQQARRRAPAAFRADRRGPEGAGRGNDEDRHRPDHLVQLQA